MKEQMKAMARPYGTLFLIALAVALVGASAWPRWI